jgi:hypothetical protein
MKRRDFITLLGGAARSFVPSSRPAGATARRAQVPSRLAVAMTLQLAFSRLAVDN